MGVGDEIAHRVATPQHFLEETPVGVGRLDDAHARLPEPTLHTLDGFSESERALMQAGIRADPNERIRSPASTNRPDRTH